MDKTSSNTLADTKMLQLNREASGLLGILCDQRILRLYWKSNIHDDEVSNKAPVFILRMTQLLP